MPRLDEATALRLGTLRVGRVILGPDVVWSDGGDPVVQVLPSIQGTPELGATLTADPGVWGNEPDSFEVSWFRGATLMGTGLTYVASTPGVITIQVTATNAAGSSVAASEGVMVWSPEGTYATFAPGLDTMMIEEGNMIAHKINNIDPPHYGHCTTTDALTGLVYFEAIITFNAPYGNAAVIHFYGGDKPASEYPYESSIGWWWEEPGVAIGMTSEWTAITFANMGLPGEIGQSSMYVFDRNDFPTIRRFRFAVNVATRAIWFTTDDGPHGGWVGGGDPAAGTDPTVVLHGTLPIRVGGTSSMITNTVELVHPDIFAHAPPAGFTAGILATP